MIDASVSLGRTEDGVVFRGTDVTWVYTGYRALSRVMRARFNQEEAEDRVAEISECFRQWDAPVLWVVGPSSWPPELPEILHESGFGTSEYWTGMAVDLKTLPGALAIPPSMRIETVSDTSALATWTTVTNEAWAGESPETAVQIFAPENAGGDPRCRYYLAYHNDKPIARAMSYVRGEVVGLYWIAAVKEFRNSDCEVILARQALAEAQSNGARIGVMPSYNGTHAVSEKLHFSAYCQFKVYAWPSKTPSMMV